MACQTPRATMASVSRKHIFTWTTLRSVTPPSSFHGQFLAQLLTLILI